MRTSFRSARGVREIELNACCQPMPFNFVQHFPNRPEGTQALFINQLIDVPAHSSIKTSAELK